MQSGRDPVPRERLRSTSHGCLICAEPRPPVTTPLGTGLGSQTEEKPLWAGWCRCPLPAPHSFVGHSRKHFAARPPVRARVRPRRALPSSLQVRVLGAKKARAPPAWERARVAGRGVPGTELLCCRKGRLSMPSLQIPTRPASSVFPGLCLQQIRSRRDARARGVVHPEAPGAHVEGAAQCPQFRMVRVLGRPHSTRSYLRRRETGTCLRSFPH